MMIMPRTIHRTIRTKVIMPRTNTNYVKDYNYNVKD